MWKTKKGRREQDPGGPWLGQLSDGDGAAGPKLAGGRGPGEEGDWAVCAAPGGRGRDS